MRWTSPKQEFRNFRNIKIVACGTSWHAGLAGKFMIERLARIPVEVDYGSEFRYRDPILDDHTLVICISQSGETADTLAAQREAKQKGAKTLAICNVVGSMITREAAGTILTHAGPEIGVASTKAFTGQLTALMLMALYLGQVRGKLSADVAQATHAGIHAPSAQNGNHPARRRGRHLRSARAAILPLHRFSVSRRAASTTPSLSKARSSSRKSPTSTPKAIPPAK